MLFRSKIMLLEKAVNRSVDMPPADAQNYMRLNYMSRYFLTGIVVFVALVSDWISLLGVVLGLFAFTPATFITGKLETAKKA